MKLVSVVVFTVGATIWALATIGWVLTFKERIAERRVEKNRRMAARTGIARRLAEMECLRIETQAGKDHPADGDVSMVIYAETEAEAADLIDVCQRVGGLEASGEMIRLHKP